jgi:DNA-binding PadR family transcriptional regulator
MYELFILSELMDRPKTGYDLQKILQYVLGSHRKVSFGVMYLLLNKLSDAKFITLTDDREGEGRAKNCNYY